MGEHLRGLRPLGIAMPQVSAHMGKGPWGVPGPSSIAGVGRRHGGQDCRGGSGDLPGAAGCERFLRLDLW